MGFTCDCELEIDGGTPEDRKSASAIVLASECVQEGEEALRAAESGLSIRFTSVDGLPEDELAAAAPQFPGLRLTLSYFSRDGEFYGYARSGEGGEAADSADFDDSTFETLTREYSGDGIALVKAEFDLGPGRRR